MRIAILMEATRFSGPARNLLYALDLLRDACDIVFCTFRRTGQADSEFVVSLRARGYQVEVIDESGPYDPRAAWRLCRLLAQLRPDVVQVHNTKSRLFALGCALARRIDRRRLLFFFHGETWVDAKQRLYDRLDRTLFKMARQVAVVSPHQIPLLESWGISRDRIRVITNVIPVIEPTVRPRNARPVLMSAGRLSAEKGYDVLLEAVAAVQRRRGECLTLRLYGEGPELPALQRQARSLGLGDCVEFMGHVPDLEPCYRQADLFVLPSRSEGLPNVLLESAMLGVPILATSVGGIPDLFERDAEAVLVPSNSVTVLSQAIEDFLDRPAQWLERAGAARRCVCGRYVPPAKAGLLLEGWQKLARSRELESVSASSTASSGSCKR